MALESLDIKRRSATTTASTQIRTPIGGDVAKLIDVTTCIGCKACQVACSEWNDLDGVVGECDGTYNNPTDLSATAWTVMRFTEYVNENKNDRLEWLIRKDGCMHCEDPGCLKACPSPGAIIQYTNGIVDFHQENCIGCGYCVIGCPFNIPRLSEKDNKAYKCSLCSDRIAVGQEPACAKTCPTGAIRFGTKEDMKMYAEKRIADLKQRGFEHAGLYNPQGVGGTHVMYVLQHNNQPSLYSGLPDNPKINTAVSLWKGATKPLAIGIMIFAGIAGLLHHVAVPPLEPIKRDAEEAERLAIQRRKAAGVIPAGEEDENAR